LSSNIKPQIEYDYTIRLPLEEERQSRILDDPSRFKVVACGRRWGKTISGLIAAIKGHGPIQQNGEPLYPGAIYGKKIFWVAPSYPILSDIWRAAKFALQDATIQKNENDHRIDIPNGGSITVRSTEKYDNLRGAGIDGLILDEAAFIAHEAWTKALRPMLVDRQGWAMFLSTPKGQNWFYHLYQMAQTTPGWRAWTAPSTENPRNTEEEIAAIKADPELTQADYEQEYEAKFVAPGLNTFQEDWFRFYVKDEIEESVTLMDDKENSSKTRTYHISELFKFGTVDLAISEKKTADYTVFQIWGVTPKNDLVLLHNLRDRMDNPTQLKTLRDLYNEWGVAYFGIESVAYQRALIQQAQNEGLPVRPVAADKGKQARAALATTRMEAGKVFFSQSAHYWPSLRDEILSFPHAKHDDQVDALAYAAQLLGLRPRKMLVTQSELDNYIEEGIFSLSDPTNLDPVMMESNESGLADDYLIAMREKMEYATFRPFDPISGKPNPDVSPFAVAYGVEELLYNVSKRFVGDGFPYWHAHIALSKDKRYAAIALARILRWDAMVETAEGQPYVIEVPFYEVPLLLKIIAPEDRNVSPAVLSDFIIALNRVRKFNITSATLTGLGSSTVAQKLSRANIVVPGLKVDSDTTIPTGMAQETRNQVQPYNDLVLALSTKRIALTNSSHILTEILQVDDEGKSLSGESTAIDAVANSIGFLSRYGHQEFVDTTGNGEILSLEDVGYTPYEFRM
jgi:predicted phage terminase large subunit-like protein